MTTTVTILGSGTCVPRLDRSACAALVQTGDATILIDAGPGTMRRLLHANVTIFDLTHILLTHFHPDHSAEIVPLIFATKYPDSDRRQQPFTLAGGPGFDAFYDGLKGVYGRWIELPAAQMEIRQLAPGSDLLTGTAFRLSAAAMAHSPESLAYRIDTAGGASVVFSGDTDESDALIALASGADLLVCEAAMPDGQKVPGHLTPSLAGRIATAAGVRRLALTHLYPPCDETDIEKQARSTYKGALTVAEDLMRFDLA